MDDTWRALPEGTTLRACGPGGYAALAAEWSETVYAPRAPIIGDADAGDDVFFILEGRVRASTFTGTGREVRFADLGPGACVGEIAAIDGGARSTNVTAITETRAARITVARFNRLIDSNTDVMRAFLSYLARRVRVLSGRLLNLTTMSARERLVAELLTRARPRRGKPDVAVIEALPTQQELADAIFGQREAVGRDLSRLRRLGLIKREGRRLEILSVAGLTAELQGE
ncbi:MAG: Crp/Fnr family transcriptional regulator [Pseudomonadota bacterium]